MRVRSSVFSLYPGPIAIKSNVKSPRDNSLRLEVLATLTTEHPVPPPPTQWSFACGSILSWPSSQSPSMTCPKQGPGSDSSPCKTGACTRLLLHLRVCCALPQRPHPVTISLQGTSGGLTWWWGQRSAPRQQAQVGQNSPASTTWYFSHLSPTHLGSTRWVPAGS